MCTFLVTTYSLLLGFFIEEEAEEKEKREQNRAISQIKKSKQRERSTKYGSIYEFSSQENNDVQWEADGSIQAASLSKLILYITHPSNHGTF